MTISIEAKGDIIFVTVSKYELLCGFISTKSQKRRRLHQGSVNK